jgi:cell division transport system permease protein
MRASFVFSEVLTGLRRNVTMTVAMILTTMISLALLGGGLLVVRMIDKTQAVYRGDVDVNVYLTKDISANDASCGQDPCKTLRSTLE